MMHRENRVTAAFLRGWLSACATALCVAAQYQIFKATNGYTGTFALASDWPSGWDVQYDGDGAYIRPVAGLIMYIK